MVPEPQALDALRATLPWWFGLAPLLLAPIALVLAWLGVYLGVSLAALSWRRVPSGAHWTERARRGWPPRVVASRAPLPLAFTIALASVYLLGPLSSVPPGALAGMIGIAACAGAWPQVRRTERMVCGVRRPLAESLAGQAFTFLALRPHTLVLILALAWMPAELPGALIGSGIVLAALVAIARGGGLRLATMVGLARPADARLARIVAETSARVGVPAPRAWIVRWPTVNALAYPQSGDLAFTEDALAQLTDTELASITAHELGHLSEPRSAVLARSLGVIALLPIAIVRPALHAVGEDPLAKLGVVFGVLVVALAMLLVVRAVARRMEVRADSVAHAHEDDPGAYARALERVCALNLLPAVTGERRPIHPHLYDRLISVGLTPPYPRPAAPPRLLLGMGLFVALLLPLGGIGAIRAACERAPAMEASLAMALGGGDRRDLWRLAALRDERGDLSGALAVLDALAVIDHRDPMSVTWVSIVAARAGECQRSRAAFEEAERRTHAAGASTDLLVQTWAAVSSCREDPHASR